MNPDPLDDLIERWRDDTLSDEQAGELNRMLRESEVARHRFRREARLHGLLHHAVMMSTLTGNSPAVPSGLRPAPADSFLVRFRWVRWHSIAAAAVIVLGTIWLIRTWPTEKIPDDAISTLVFADGCDWQSSNAPKEGQRLPSGLLRLRSGMAVVRFDGGAAVVLRAGSEFDLRSRGSGFLRKGEVVVRTSDEAAGFILHTPASEIVDLGAEFAARVESSGATEIHVLEGSVAYRKPTAGDLEYDEVLGEVLPAGQAVRFESLNAHVPRAVDLNAKGFDELIAQTPPKSPIGPLIAHEPFNYPVGKMQLEETNGGTGWTQHWKLAPWLTGARSVPNPVISIATDQEPGGSAAPSLVGKRLEAFDRFNTIVRQFKEPVRMDRDGVWYVSVRVRWEPQSASPPPGSMTRFALRTSADMFGDLVLLNLPSHLRPQIEQRENDTVTGAIPVPVNESQLWVAKFVTRERGEDEIYFHIFREADIPGWIEPTTWSVSKQGIRSNFQFDTLILSAFGPCKRWFGDVRVGTTWRAVVPPAAPPFAAEQPRVPLLPL